MRPIRKSRRFGLNFWFNSFNDVINLIYPSSCIICEVELSKNERFCCFQCLEDLPYTHYEKFKEPSPLDKLFWGRIHFERTFSLLFFEKDKGTQKLLHELKYNNNMLLGIEMGRLISDKCNETELFQDIDFLVPVPLHHRKKFLRGYNQSEALATGISEKTGIPCLNTLVGKSRHTSSQTRKGRFLRWDNVQEQFTVNKGLNLNFNHLALIDDVITTGATIESIARVIQQNYPDIRISIISLAIAK